MRDCSDYMVYARLFVKICAVNAYDILYLILTLIICLPHFLGFLTSMSSGSHILHSSQNTGG
jgi:hypothetical protein